MSGTHESVQALTVKITSPQTTSAECARRPQICKPIQSSVNRIPRPSQDAKTANSDNDLTILFKFADHYQLLQATGFFFFLGGGGGGGSGGGSRSSKTHNHRGAARIITDIITSILPRRRNNKYDTGTADIEIAPQDPMANALRKNGRA